MVAPQKKKKKKKKRKREIRDRKGKNEAVEMIREHNYFDKAVGMGRN